MKLSKRIGWIVGCVAVAFLVVNASAGEGRQILGTAPAAGETVSIYELLDTPEEYVGKTVRVEGMIKDVCPKRGCWMTLIQAAGDEREIRIKVQDDVIVFPMDAKGHEAVAEGKFVKHEMDLKQSVSYLKHMAEERGEEFDAASVTKPVTRYEIAGTGAVIHR